MLKNDTKRVLHAKHMRMATVASVLVAIFLIIIKLMAYVLTGSVTILSSLLDSFLDALASIINLIAVRHALEPADREHRFGHGKAEPIAGLAQAGFIIASSGFLLFEAIKRFKNPQIIEHVETGIIVILISIVLTFILVVYQRYVAKLTGSIAIYADSIHYLSDFLLNILVIVSLLLVSQFNLPWIDPLFAVCIAVYIVISARKIAIQSLDQLMDRELVDEERERIKAIVLEHNSVSAIRKLRTRLSGRDTFIQFHLGMNGNLSLAAANQIANEVRESLLESYPEADIFIHQGPT